MSLSALELPLPVFRLGPGGLGLLLLLLAHLERQAGDGLEADLAAGLGGDGGIGYLAGLDAHDERVASLGLSERLLGRRSARRVVVVVDNARMIAVVRDLGIGRGGGRLPGGTLTAYPEAGF